MKRKAAACMLAAALAATCIPTTAMAEGYTYGGAEGADTIPSDQKLGDIDVKVQVQNESVTHKYAVSLITKEMTFVYDLGTSTWNPSDHQYTGDTSDWETNSQTFTVENHSDLAIKVKVPDSIDSNLTGVDVTAAFSDSKKEVTLGAHPIGEAVDGDWKTDGTITLTGTPTGIDPEDYETAQSIATVTVTINEAN